MHELLSYFSHHPHQLQSHRRCFTNCPSSSFHLFLLFSTVISIMLSNCTSIKVSSSQSQVPPTDLLHHILLFAYQPYCSLCHIGSSQFRHFCPLRALIHIVIQNNMHITECSFQSLLLPAARSCISPCFSV